VGKCDVCNIKGIPFTAKLLYVDNGKRKEVLFCSEKCLKEFVEGEKFDFV